LPIICSRKWLVWNRTIQDLAEWFPSILDIEEEKLFRRYNSPDIVFVNLKEFYIVSIVTSRNSDDFIDSRGPSRFFLLV
tara:strand:+ start:147 stop:383 length:237 start_codon:yes stop_codon:yes gene_type:complete